MQDWVSKTRMEMGVKGSCVGCDTGQEGILLHRASVVWWLTVMQTGSRT